MTKIVGVFVCIFWHLNCLLLFGCFLCFISCVSLCLLLSFSFFFFFCGAFLFFSSSLISFTYSSVVSSPDCCFRRSLVCWGRTTFGRGCSSWKDTFALLVLGWSLFVADWGAVGGSSRREATVLDAVLVEAWSTVVSVSESVSVSMACSACSKWSANSLSGVSEGSWASSGMTVGSNG